MPAVWWDDVMRFKADGPAIPDILLEERDAGNVVFLCGAGVSIPAGLPNFADLARAVIDKLDPPPDSEIRQAFGWLDEDSIVPKGLRPPELDHLFQLLERDYEREQVERAVWKRLAQAGSTPSTPTREHAIVARLSANQEGQPQVVTTNFDRLFESALAGKKPTFYVPPMYPDLRHVPATGLTYLHGRLADDESGPHNYILSSADLGRAYLAEGWATRFIRQLLQHYTVVLLGYRAEDPPVKYLFQGLEEIGAQTANGLFAFDQGPCEEVEAKWQDRGVRAIPYRGDHQTLWETLAAWADRADDPTAWRTAVVESSGRGPRKLAPHERGMVAHLVRTPIGARQFADRKPTPSAEWLCVFDAACRYAKPGLGKDSNRADPLEAYRLDDDLPRPSRDYQGHSWPGDDLITWRRGDESVDGWQRLSHVHSLSSDPMPSRLHHLARWLVSCVKDPVLAWWVARQRALHPRLHEMLKRAVENDTAFNDNARRVWMILFEVLDGGPPESVESAWFEVQKRIKRQGWTSAVIRALEAATEPVFAVTANYGEFGTVQAVRADWSEVDWWAIFKVHFPAPTTTPPIVLDADLEAVYAAIERNLRRASERLREIETPWLNLRTFHLPEDGESHPSEPDVYVGWFRELLDRLAALAPDRLGRHIALWPDPDPPIFDRLRLYVWNRRELFSGDEAAERVLALSEEQFWQAELWRSEHRRDLLFLLRVRWTDFPEERRNLIARRILDGPPARQDDDEADRTVRSRIAAVRFGWLTLGADCEFPDRLLKEWTTLKQSLPAWKDDWVDDAVSTSGLSVGWGRTNEDSSVLDGVPIGKIVEVARARSGTSSDRFVENRPFAGLVKKRPRRAILALGTAARRVEFPEELWESVVRDWPDPVPRCARRATRFLLGRLSRLPSSTIVALRHELGQWLQDRFPGAAADDEGLAYRVFDRVVDCLVTGGSATTESASGEQTSGGERVRGPGRLHAAINAPVGKAAEGLLKALAAGGLERGAGLPVDFKTRVERLLTAPGEGAGHAVSVLSTRIDWLNHVDDAWVTANMIPWFDLAHHHSKSAWSGILWSCWQRVQPVFDAIRDSFLVLPPGMYTWASREETDQYCCWIVAATLLAGDDGPRLSFEEARHCLRRIDGEGRQHVIWVLSEVGANNDDGWRQLVMPFVERAWPNERTYQTAETTLRWLSLLRRTEDSFPEVLAAVRGHLRHIKPQLPGLYGFHRGAEAHELLTTKFPRETLDLLDRVTPTDPRDAPYGLSEVLELLVEAKTDLVADQRYKRLHKLALGP